MQGVPACRPEDGLLTISVLPSLQACTGQELLVALEVSNGEGPFQWFTTSLAPGLVLEQDTSRRATLRGTVREVGSFQLALGVRDAHNCAQVTVPVTVAETPRITTVWPDACTATPFELQLEAEGGDPATYVWSYQGEQPLEQLGSKLYGRTPGEDGVYAVQLTLRDAHCPLGGEAPVVLDQQWTVRGPGECPSIVTAQLPAPCEGIPYSQQLAASAGSGVGYRWTASSAELPSGLLFDPERGVVEGTPTGATRSGSLDLLLTDSLGQRASAALDLTLRDDCRIAWIAGEPPRLQLGDVYLSREPLALPAQLAPGDGVLDMKYSPGGGWLAFRAGATGAERLHLHRVTSGAADAQALAFACPEPNACAVLDYAWAPDGRHVAVVLGGGAQDFISGASLDDSEVPAAWPVIGTVPSSGSELPLDYLRDLSWAGDSLAFVAASGPDANRPETVVMAQAGLAGGLQGTPYFENDVRLRPVRAGWLAYDAFLYSTTFLSPSELSRHSVGWPSPSGEYVGRVLDGQLSIYAASGDGALATTEGGCAVVAAWSARASGTERILCSGGAIGAPDGDALRVYDFDVARAALVPPAGRAVPLSGAYSPQPLANSRRFFTPAADWLVLGAPEQGVTLLPLPAGTDALPLPTALLTVEAPAELSFSPDGRSLLIYDQGELLSEPVPASAEHSILSIDGAGRALTPAQLATCDEAVWAAPDNWCGAPDAVSHFLVSADSKSVLFEAEDALWVADLGLRRDVAPRRIAALPASCGSRCAGVSYGFAPRP